MEFNPRRSRLWTFAISMQMWRTPGFELVGAPGVPGILRRGKGVSAHGVLVVVVVVVIVIISFKFGMFGWAEKRLLSIWPFTTSYYYILSFLCIFLR